MSFKGEIETKCPACSEPFEVEIWSFISGESSPELRDALKARECNLLLCPACAVPFVPDAAYVYYEPSAEILAFVFPESYRAEEAHWRAKMGEDFLTFKKGLEGKMSVDIEPELFFGQDGLAELLDDEDYRSEEREVMEAVGAELGLSFYRISPLYARRNRIPSSLPYAGAKATVTSVIAGLQKVLEANDRLTAFAAMLERLRASKDGLPPPSHAGRS